MKVQFKYAILAELHFRGIVFAVIFAMNFIFLLLGALGVLPVAALITAVTLSGIAVSVMAIVNIICNIGIIRRMFYAPRAYVLALTPTPRYKTLLANVAAIAMLDTVTMTVAITSVTWLSLMLAGEFTDIAAHMQNFPPIDAYTILSIIGGAVLLLASYLLLAMFIITCIIVKRSLFYQKRAGGLLTALVALGGMYIFSVSQLILAPFGTVTRFGLFIHINLGGLLGLIPYAIFTLLYVAVLFIIASKLMERKLNI